MARILVIDDDKDLLSIMEDALTLSGHSVVTASDGRRGETLFRSHPFDVIITDIVMPEREGLEIITVLHREFPQIPVIAITGTIKHSALYLRIATRLGAQRVLDKPFSRQALVEAVASVL